MKFDKRHNAVIKKIAELAKTLGGKAYCVGGCVRDSLMGSSPEDYDIEIYGIQSDEIERMLKNNFRVEMVGKSFGVWILKGYDIDVSIPRRERKSGVGHKAFDVEGDPFLPIEEACARRDFTINSILYDVLEEKILDPFNGLSDIKKKILRHTSSRFQEDPLRVLRAMQFTARFMYSVAPETVEICKTIDIENLPHERIFEEWKKLLLKGKKISFGLEFLKDCGWVKYFPELEAMIGCVQDKRWHPEGDVYTHTGHCMDSFAKDRIGDDREDLIVGFAVLCHDMGKPLTTKIDDDGSIHSYGHDVQGKLPTIKFLQRLTKEKSLIYAVVPLVDRHMAVLDLWRNNAGDSAIRRLANKVGRIDRLVRVDKADREGRPPLETEESPQGAWIIRRAEELAIKDSAPQPIIMGRHLIEMGMVPSIEFKKILEEAYEAQLDGKFFTTDDGIKYIKNFCKNQL